MLLWLQYGSLMKDFVLNQFQWRSSRLYKTQRTAEFITTSSFPLTSSPWAPYSFVAKILWILNLQCSLYYSIISILTAIYLVESLSFLTYTLWWSLSGLCFSSVFLQGSPHRVSKSEIRCLLLLFFFSKSLINHL